MRPHRRVSAPESPSRQADRIAFLTEGTARHGDFWRFASHVYVAASAELAKEAYRRTGKDFKVPDGMFRLPDQVRRALPAGAFLPNSIAPARSHFGHSAVSRSVGVLATEAARTADLWPTDQAVPVLPALRRMFSRMGAHYCFGVDAAPLMHVEAALARARESAPPRTLYLPTPTRRRLQRRLGALAGRIGALMEERLRQGRTAEPDLLGVMIESSLRHGTPPGVNITFPLAVILLASQEQPTRAGGWHLLGLARHPDLADRIADEAALLPDDPRKITAADLARLTHADAFVRETLRHYPPIWLSTRLATTSTRVGEHRLDSGDRLMLSPYLIHHDERYHADPERFDPDRWLCPDAASGGDAAATGGYVPFGAGPRLCPGAALAGVELTLLVALTARALRLSCPSPEPFRLTTAGALTPSDLRLVFSHRA
ncbi:cytochrome P450 [Actinomadura harenae]|uniref:Cytochrome P450 n=2 Tax=Actinomadura harenae TaxID=2483351 RepID=A0A3M2MKE0_9ACTN|nr:cytochrome P450 [Actinomadura harenae]